MKVVLESFLADGAQEFRLGDRPMVIGREETCAIQIPSPYVSRQHAVISPGPGGHVLRTSGVNGTFVNHQLLREGDDHVLKPDDVISVGGFTLHVVGDKARQGAAVKSSIEVIRQYSALRNRMHQQLIVALDLRSMGGRDMNDIERRQRFDAAFSSVFEADLGLPEELSSFIILEAVRTGLMDRLVLPKVPGTTTAEGADTSSFFNASPHEQTYQQLVSTCMRELGISRDARFARDAVMSISEGSDRVANTHSRALFPGVRQYIVKRQIRRDLEALVFGLGPLEDLIRTPDINEIMVVSPELIYIEKHGEVEETGRCFPTSDDLEVAIARILAPAGRTVSRSQPIVDARLADGSRVNVVIPPIALRGPTITIRKFRKEPFSLEDLVQFGSINRQAVIFLRACIRGRKNLVISGGTGSGKTTLLNTLSSQIPPDQRIIVIEDSAELQLQQPHVVRLEARRANTEGQGALPIRELVRASLRMRPDRIVVGECRGGEALDMLQAMNTGHDGSMTTGHANSPRDMISRLEVMVLEAGEGLPIQAIHRQIAAAVDVIVQIERCRDKVRRVTQISECVGYDSEEGMILLEDVFHLVDGAGENGKPALCFTGYLPTFMDAMLAARDVELEDLF